MLVVGVGLGLGSSWRGSGGTLVGWVPGPWPAWLSVHEGVQDKGADSSAVHLSPESDWKKVVDYQWESCCPFGNSWVRREQSCLFA